MDTPNTKAAANEPAPWGRTGTKALSLSLYFLLLMGFLLLRLVLVRAPLNSDDNNYLYLSRYLLTGEHAVFRSTLPEALSLQALRFGLLIPTAASIKLFGYNSIAYYLPPFVFSLAGCFLIISISRRFLPWLGVAAVVVMHTVLPFETRHSSLLLTDLPAAVMLLGYFVYLDKYSSAITTRLEWVQHSLASGLLLLWAYFLRENSVVLVLPGILLLLRYPRSRLLCGSSFCVLLLGIVVEQIFYSCKHAPIGYRWTVVSTSMLNWLPSMDLLTIPQYLLRPFSFVLRDVGFGGLLFLCLSLIAHVYCIFRASDLVVKTTTLTGLTTWLAFSYSIFKVDHHQIFALAYMHRYVQLFAYTSLVALPYTISATSLKGRLPAPGSQSSFIPGKFSSAYAISALGIILYFSAVAIFFADSYFNSGRLFDPQCEFGAVLRHLADEAKSTPNTTLRVTGSSDGIRALSLFAVAGSRNLVHWEPVPYETMPEKISRGEADYLVRDLKRELNNISLVSMGTKERLQALMSELDLACWRQYHSLFGGDEFILSKRGEESKNAYLRAPNMSMTRFNVDAQSIEDWSIMERDTIRLARTSDGSLEVNCAVQGGNYITSGNDNRFDVPPPHREDYRLSPQIRYDGFVDVRMTGSVQVLFWVIEYDDSKRLGHSTRSLHPGANVISFKTGVGAQYYRIAIRLSGQGTVIFREIAIRRVGN